MRAMACTPRRIPLPSGLGIHVLEWGAGEAALDHTVVLLHGFLENAWAWEATVESGLAGRFHVVSVDLRGHGDSDRVGVGGNYHFPDYLGDLHELIPRVRRGRVSLVGHSMGGFIAGFYAGVSSDVFERLVIMEGTGLPGKGPWDDPLRERVTRWLRRRTEVQERPQNSYASVAEAAARLQKIDPTLRRELAQRLAEKGTRPSPDGRVRFKHDPRLTVGVVSDFDLEQARAIWSEITCPVLIIEGERSGIRLPEDEARRRWSVFRQHRSIVLPDAGHMMHRDQPEALARHLAQFLGDT
jgi:pimeloyl-ACP methyl ester carboxylesterase